MTDNLFEGGDQNQPQIDPDKDYYVELVGENKPFKDNKALARGKYEADRTVDLMKARLDEMRADYQRLHEDRQQGATLKELVDQLKSSTQPSQQAITQQEDVKQPDPELLKKSVLDEIKREQREELERSNLQTVQSKLREHYGENYQSVLNSQREKLRLSIEDVNAIGRKSPEAFFRLMNLDNPTRTDSFQSPPRSVTRSDTFAPTSQKRTWAYYQDLKKKDKALYYSPKIFNQMLKDAEDLGDAFKDGDYKQFGDL